MVDLVTSSTLPSFQLRNNMYNKKNITTIKEGGFQMNIKNLRTMKTLITLAVIIFTINLSLAQETRYQTNKAALKINAFKNGENYQWENKNITTFLDYRNGDFTTRLKNTDFISTIHPEFHEQTAGEEKFEYVFKGILPIREIINQKSINQTYPVELQLICEELGLDETIAFQITITRPGSGTTNYRIFTFQGKLYNDELQLPAFYGFDNEIELWIIFNAFSNN